MSAQPAAALLYLATHPDATTSDVGKALFSPQNDRELRNADRRVRYWLTEKYDDLVEASDGEDPTTYRIKDKKVYAGLARLEVETFAGESLSIGLGGTVVHFDGDGKINVETAGEIEPDEHPTPPPTANR